MAARRPISAIPPSSDRSSADDRTTQETHAATTTSVTTTTTIATTTGDSNRAEAAGQALDDEQTVIKLYETSRQHLWDAFGDIHRFCEKADEEVLDYDTLIALMQNVRNRTTYDSDVEALAQCAAAAGFATQAAKVIRMAMGTGALFGSSRDPESPSAYCSKRLLSMLLSYTYFGNEIRLRLMKAGIFRHFVECLKVFRHITYEALYSRKNRLNVIGILLNCCKSPEVAATVKHMDVIPHLAPFLDKSEDIVIRLATFFLLAYIVDDTQLNYLELDHAMLDHSLCCLRQALGFLNPDWGYKFPVEDVTIGLCLATRLEFNQKLIVAKEGAIELHKTILEKGQQENIHFVLSVFAQLATDPNNAKIFKRDKELMKILSGLRDKEHSQDVEVATKIITKLQEAVSEEVDLKENISLAEVLTNQSNALIILNVGKVEFLLNRLTDVISGRRASCASWQVSGVKVIKALRELAKHESCRREIMARGGLSLLQTFLQRNGMDDRLESILLLKDLASCKEYSILIQAVEGLMESVQKLTRHDNQQVRQAASQLVDVIMGTAGDSVIITSTPP